MKLTYHQKYYLEHKETIKTQSKNWIKNNRERHNKLVMDWSKKVNYVNEKTKEQRKIRNIKCQTRNNFPLKGNFCKCGKKAEVRHHNTKPIEWNKFIFMCIPCHRQLHKKLNHRRLKNDKKTIHKKRI